MILCVEFAFQMFLFASYLFQKILMRVPVQKYRLLQIRSINKYSTLHHKADAFCINLTTNTMLLSNEENTQIYGMRLHIFCWLYDTLYRQICFCTQSRSLCKIDKKHRCRLNVMCVRLKKYLGRQREFLWSIIQTLI